MKAPGIPVRAEFLRLALNLSKIKLQSSHIERQVANKLNRTTFPRSVVNYGSSIAVQSCRNDST